MYTIAIGDIHGCLEQLNELLSEIELYTKSRNIDGYTLLFVGDYIDRGLDSKGVIDRVMQLQQERPNQVIALMGNHEDMIIDVINGEWSYVWESNGGWITNTSFQVSHPKDIGDKYKVWLKGLKLFHDDGKRFFVHAGVLPLVPLKENSRETMLWERTHFLSWKKPWDRYIVHGHTITEYDTSNKGEDPWSPRELFNRLNLDTGCVFGGKLTAAIFNDMQGKPIDYIQVDGLKNRPGRGDL